MIKLLSVSVTENPDDENVEIIVDSGTMLAQIATVFKHSQPHHERYIPCLNLIANISNANSTAANKFIERGADGLLLKQITQSLQVYKIEKRLFREGDMVSIQDQIKASQSLAAQITTLGGLLQSDNEGYRIRILADPIVMYMIEIMSHDRHEIILLTAVCTFALDLFECVELRDDPVFMEPFAEMTGYLTHIMPYLGFEYYPRLLEQAQFYHDNSANASDEVEQALNDPLQHIFEYEDRDDMDEDEKASIV